MKNYYSILRIDRKASKVEIKSAFRELSKKYHPDINKAKNASEKFIEIYEAYEILSDQNKRIAYDELLNKENSSITEIKTYSEYEKWSESARAKGKEFSQMSFSDFTKKVLKALANTGLFVIGGTLYLALLGILSLINPIEVGISAITSMFSVVAFKISPIFGFISLGIAIYHWIMVFSFKSLGYTSFTHYLIEEKNKNKFKVYSTAFSFIYLIGFSLYVYNFMT